MTRSIDIVIPAKNPGEPFIKCIQAWLDQKMPDGWSYHLYVVDDGSTDGILMELAQRSEARLHILRNEVSLGRGPAINVGARAGSGEYLAFFDADCLPVSNSVLGHYVSALSLGVTLAFGKLETRGEDFWARYFHDVADNREKRFLAGDRHALTTANCIIKRTLFDRAGQFDERYRHYGFEDRDLIARLLILDPKLAHVPQAGVIHGDSLSLEVICRKMRIAGRHSAALFQHDHPEIYRQMLFSRVDVRCGGSLRRMLASAIQPFIGRVLWAGDFLLKRDIPYQVKSMVVKVCSGIYFLVGSKEAES